MILSFKTLMMWSLRRFIQYLYNYSAHIFTEKRKCHKVYRILHLYVGAGQTHTSEMDMPMVLPCWGVHTCMVSDAHGPQGKPKLSYLDYVHSCNLTATCSCCDRQTWNIPLNGSSFNLAQATTARSSEVMCCGFVCWSLVWVQRHALGHFSLRAGELRR